MDCYDQDIRRLLCRERAAQLARDARPRRERTLPQDSRLHSLYDLPRPAADRRRQQPA